MKTQTHKKLYAQQSVGKNTYGIAVLCSRQPEFQAVMMFDVSQFKGGLPSELFNKICIPLPRSIDERRY
jgi:hypothetical protein